MKLNSFLLSGVAAFAVLLGCKEAPPPDDGLPKPEPIQDRVELKSFESCEALESYIEDTAVLDMRTSLEAAKKGYGWGWGVADRGGAEMAAGAANGGAAAPAAPSAYTQTNTQVAGVDEADFVKNDGTRIFVLSGKTLYAAKSWPATDLAVVGKLTVEGWPREMFLAGQDRLVVFSNVYNAQVGFVTSGGAAPACGAGYCADFYSANVTKVTVVNVSNLQAPAVETELFFPGYYNNSRRVGEAVRLVLADSFRWPSGVRFYPDHLYSARSTTYSQADREREYDQLMDENEKIIRAQSLAGWIPAGWLKRADGSTAPIAYSCTDFKKSNAPTKLGIVSVVTVNLAAPENPSRVSVVAQSGEVYASTKALYIANQHWWWWPEPGQMDATYLHKFDITQPDTARYVASGRAPGHIVDQFSMDENAAGFFRVATTITSRVRDEQNPTNWWGRVETVNRVSVLAEVQGFLEVVGQSADLEPGERIYSSRFMEDKGYVVTFRQIDPLLTFDLTDPAHPRQVGALKVPGFSTYLHPVGPNHLLAIGTYIPENNRDWRLRAMKLTLFDVTDLSNPKEAFTQLVGNSYGYSEAQYEHKAFNYFPEKKLLAIPFWDYSFNATANDYWSYFTSDLRVFSVDTAQGITPLGALSMKDLYQKHTYDGWYYYWTPMVRRSVMADNFAYAISDSGIRVADIASLSSPVATALFDKPVF